LPESGHQQPDDAAKSDDEGDLKKEEADLHGDVSAKGIRWVELEP
jgi:hypothetical protein